MVHQASFGGIRRRPSAVAPPAGIAVGSWTPVKFKTELEDDLQEEYAPLSKRMKQPPFSDQLIPVEPSEYNPLAEPSPLGLRLKKSPSLLDLIQTRLSQGYTPSLESKSITLESKSIENSTTRGIAAMRSTEPPISNDKLKASNFPASLLRIGQWEYASKHEGDLVAKCYFAKHKLVWEVLQGGLKSKIEIQWSDIVGLNAKLPEDGPAMLTVVLARQPIFYRETNPQPRKHTLWQTTADFTDGQASIHRQHFLLVPLGVLNKHFEKLIQCDMRLNYLSHQPKMVIDSPYFESLSPALEDSKNLQIELLDQRIGANNSSSIVGSPQSISQNSSGKTKQENLLRMENLSNQVPSPSSVMDMRAIEGYVSSDAGTLGGSKNWEQRIMQGLRPSMSMTDLVNHIGTCISGQGVTETPSFPEEGSESRKTLEDIAQHLLGGDSHLPTCADEKSLMSRVNSLCSLLQMDGTPVQLNSEKGFRGSEDQKDVQVYGWGNEPTANHEKPTKGDIFGSEGDHSMEFSCKPTMSRKDSYGDLLLDLPRIASLPTFLFDISEDGDNKAR